MDFKNISMAELMDSEEEENSVPKKKPKAEKPAAKEYPKDDKLPGPEKKQRRLIKKRRGGEILSEDEVQKIKRGRKMLRREMRKRKIYSKKEFELTASSLGLYFDKYRGLAGWLWWLKGRELWALLGAALLLLLFLLIMSAVTQIRGHFTVNMTSGMFQKGFSLSETDDFKQATTHLFAEPHADVPCISISQIDPDVDLVEGYEHPAFFSYTFYIRNEGDAPAGYEWTLALTSESRELSEAVWAMIFEDGEMRFYAKPDENGNPQAIPAVGDDSRGYLHPKMLNVLDDTSQYEVIRTLNDVSYYRAIPENYISDEEVATGRQEHVMPQEVHKYTVVLWLEGDDPDCTDALIGGHLGMQMEMDLIQEEEEHTAIWDNVFGRVFEKIWQALFPNREKTN